MHPPAVLTPYVLSGAVLGGGYTPLAGTGAATLAGSHTATVCGKPVAGADVSRVGRYAVLFSGTGGKPSVVEQIIRFSTATAAAHASQSIRAAVMACTPAGTATLTALSGIPASTVTVREVPAVPRGLPSALAKRRTAVGQYLAFQPHGATLVGVFTSGGTDDAQTVLLRHALDALATLR